MYLLKKYPHWISVTSWAESFYAPRISLDRNKNRIVSLDLLRGVVMIIMAIDHVRDYFHKDAFIYSPTDLAQTSVPLFFTRWITHFCAPVFVSLAGISASLYEMKKGKKELSFFLWTRGLWLIAVETIVLTAIKTFNFAFSYFNLQVIWAIGVSMILLAGIIQLRRNFILLIGLILVVAHNLLDHVHIEGNGILAFLWSLLHEMKEFHYGGVLIYIHYPVLPWIGVMVLGYYFGSIFSPDYSPAKRQRTLFYGGALAISIFALLRSANIYGDPAAWSVQRNPAYSFLSFLNVTKYPPSLLYLLITLGPALIFLAVTERISGKWVNRILIFGRTAMFYYLAHLLLIHIGATISTLLCGYQFSDMVTSAPLSESQQLKGYGFNLWAVYLIWGILISLLYPLCKWYDNYKRENINKQWWLSYL